MEETNNTEIQAPSTGTDETKNKDLNTLEPDDKAIVEVGKSVTGADSKQTFLILAAILVIAAGVIYYFFYSAPTPTTNDDFPLQQKPEKSSVLPIPTLDQSQPASDEGAVDPSAFKPITPPAAPKKTEPPAMPTPPVPSTPPAPPSPPVAVAAPPQPAINHDTLTKQTKMTASIILTSGGGENSSSGNTSIAQTRTLNTNFTIQPTSAQSIQVTTAGNMSLLITQGKILEAVLETPLNTNFPGPIRAILSRDVYSEKGENVLIPKGSRVIGTLQSQYTPGQDRIMVQWNRIILPNGLDVMVQNAPGVDPLGQVGVQGTAHTQFMNTIGNAVLLSIINVGAAKASQSLFNVRSGQQGYIPGTTIVPLPDGTNATVPTKAVPLVPDPVEDAASQAAQNLANTTQQWMQTNMVAKPFVSVPQGIILKIFVNQDIVFPSQVGNGVTVMK